MAQGGFARVCRDTLHDWKSARRRVLDSGASRSAVHQWRICTRRLLALEGLLAPGGAAKKRASLEGRTRDAFRASGKLRDAQLCERTLRKLASTVPDAARLARHLDKRIPHLARRLRRTLRDVQPARISLAVAKWSDEAGDNPDEVLSARASQRLRQRLRWLTPVVDPGVDARTLHRQRLRLKQARYMTELASAAGQPPPQQIAPTRLNALQSALGAVTDLDMQLRAVAKFAAAHPDWQSSARSLRRELRTQRKSALQQLPRPGR